MLLADRTSLVQFLIEERRRFPEASGELNALVLNIALACKAIARAVAHGALAGQHVAVGAQSSDQTRLDAAAHTIFVRSNEWGGQLCGMASQLHEDPVPLAAKHPRGKYLLVFDPLDGSDNVDVNLPLGSIFSVLNAPSPGLDAGAADFLQPGVRQVCAGYALYGPATMLVLTVGNGVHGFTLDRELGEFILTHPRMTIGHAAQEFAINTSDSRFWEPAVRRYVDECLAGRAGPRERDFNLRWIASIVAELHRILTRGGVFIHPGSGADPARPSQVRLLQEANPVAFLAEQAGGRASTGERRVLEVQPEALHQRTGLMFGAADEIERLERYHREQGERAYHAPLFATRGLFCNAA